MSTLEPPDSGVAAMLDESIQILLDEAEENMQKTLDHLRTELNAIRAGRASPAMLETVRVEFYGSVMPLNQMASVSAPQTDLLVVQPWDRSSLGAIERAIIAANLGMNPSNDGGMIRIPVPPPSEERRRDLARTARHRGEEAKIAIRNVRRHIKDEIKSVQQEEKLSEDMRFAGEERLQKITDEFVGRVDALLDRKEVEIMEV
jgi:ribosome recycling factor